MICGPKLRNALTFLHVKHGWEGGGSMLLGSIAWGSSRGTCMGTAFILVVAGYSMINGFMQCKITS